MDRASQSKESMRHSEPRFQCSNSHCMALNDLESSLCQQCRTPLVKHYLWAMGTKSEIYSSSCETKSYQINIENIGSLIGGRYLAITQHIFLDTKPGIMPQIPEEIPEEIAIYLQLFTYFPHIPQVYGQIDGYNIWLLDYGTVPQDSLGELQYAKQLIPQVSTIWHQSQSIRQLNLLRQLASLWKILREKKVVSSLLNPLLIRVNGSLLQLLELEPDPENQPTLKDLGKSWSQLVENADPTIAKVLKQLSMRLENGSISKIEQVLVVLDSCLDLCRQNYDYSYQVFSCSDPGPTRPSNEDAAYPNSSNPISNKNQEISLAIVCDGVGGHEGGEIAAKDTINYLRNKIEAMTFEEEQNAPGSIVKRLVKFTNDANDAICKRNDREQRQERQRMGTTVVMSLARNHEVYLNSVGDSRIYLVTSVGCHQVTIDDDLASREVRLGYAVYRDALQYPSAGALIQALGMRHSSALHPNIKRLIIDEDCVILLCTDGLSDFDRVDQYWRKRILPMLTDDISIIKTVKTLIKIANEKNGHDNATVALVHCRVKPKASNIINSIPWSKVELAIADSLIWSDIDSEILSLPDTKYVAQEPKISSTPQEEALTCNRSRKNTLRLMSTALTIVLLIALGFTIYFFYLKSEIDTKENIPNESEIQQIFPDSEQ